MQTYRHANRSAAYTGDIENRIGLTSPLSIRFRSDTKRLFPRLSALLLSALLLWGTASVARAQSTYTPGGLFVHPTAYTLQAHQFSLYTAAFTQDQDLGINNSYYNQSITYAPSDRLQVTALTAYHQAADVPSHTHLGTFLKYQLVPDTGAHPAFAITGAYVGNDHLESSVAGVVSHRFVHKGRVLSTLHLGIKWGRTPDEEGNQDDIGGFAGLQLPLNPYWDLVGETSTRFSFDRAAASSIGLMYHTRRGIGLSIGLVNGGRSSRMKPFFGVAYAIGK
jgi:hypothetical protein